MHQNKIEIYSIHYNRPDLIELQLKSFQKFIEEEFEFIVIDNSISSIISNEILKICRNNNIKYLNSNNRTPHSPMHFGWSHIHGMSFFKEQLLISNSKFVFLIEHDIFFCSAYKKISDIVNSYGVCGVSQTREHITYFHPGILLFNKSKSGDLSDFDFRGDIIENGVFNKELDGIKVDTGGQTYKYIKNNPDRVYFFKDVVNQYMEDITKDNVFYHMVRGSNWIGTEAELNSKKMEIINRFLH